MPIQRALTEWRRLLRPGAGPCVYGVRRTTVSAHVARAGKTRGLLTGAQVDEAVRLDEQGWSLRAAVCTLEDP